MELPVERTVRVALVDDHGIVRQGLRALLTLQGIEVVGEAESGFSAIDLARELRPDVMLLDIRMKDGDGLQCLPQIKEASPETSVIMLTTYANPGYLARAINSLDLRLTADGGVYFIEANPNPMLAADEDYALSAAKAGLPYPGLLTRILRLGLNARRD